MSNPLLALRHEIDRIDNAMHALLVERGDVVARVIEAKRAAGDVGSAFRPDREAELMRRIVHKPAGRWPVDTPENIWRVILATSTFTQVPYTVHADVSGGETPIRESMRFHFGFTVPFAPASDAKAVIRAVDEATAISACSCWHKPPAPAPGGKGLRHRAHRRSSRACPFAERPGHPAGLPVYVIAKPQNEGLARETIVASLQLERWRTEARGALAEIGAELVASAGNAQGAQVLVAHETTTTPEMLTAALNGAKCAPSRYAELGCHARRFALPPRNEP